MMSYLFQSGSSHLHATPNKPAAGKAGITRLLAIAHHCPGLPEPGCSLT